MYVKDIIVHVAAYSVHKQMQDNIPEASQAKPIMQKAKQCSNDVVDDLKKM